MPPPVIPAQAGTSQRGDSAAIPPHAPFRHSRAGGNLVAGRQHRDPSPRPTRHSRESGNPGIGRPPAYFRWLWCWTRPTGGIASKIPLPPAGGVVRSAGEARRWRADFPPSPPLLPSFPRRWEPRSGAAAPRSLPTPHPSFPRKRESRYRRPPAYFRWLWRWTRPTWGDCSDSPLPRLRGELEEGSARAAHTAAKNRRRT